MYKSIIPRAEFLKKNQECSYFVSNSGVDLVQTLRKKDDIELFISSETTNFEEINQITFSTATSGKISALSEPIIWVKDDKGIVISRFINGGMVRNYLDLRTNIETEIHPIQYSYTYISDAVQFPKDLIALTLSNRDPKNKDWVIINPQTQKQVAVYENYWGWNRLFFNDLLLPKYISFYEADGALSVYPYSANQKPKSRVYGFAGEDSYTSRIFELSLDGSSLYCRSSLCRDKAAAVKVDLATGKESILFEDDRFDVGSMFFHPKTKEPMACSILRETRELFPLNEWFKQFQHSLEDKIGKSFFINHQNNDFSAAVIEDKDGQQWFVKPNEKGSAFCLENNQNKPTTEAVVEPFYVTTKDNLTLLCYLTYNKNTKNEYTPLVVLPHGGPWSRDDDSWNTTAQWLTNRGYKVLTINFRGSKGFGKKLLNAGSREWGGKIIDDIAHATQQAIKKYCVMPNKVAVMGRSFGGYASLMCLIRFPNLFCAGVSGDIPTDLKEMFDIPYFSDEFPILYRHLGNPNIKKDLAQMRKYSPHYQAHRLTLPLLMTMGEHQPANIGQTVKNTVLSAQAVNNNLSYACFKGEMHGVSNPNNIEYLQYLQERFLAKFLGGRFKPWNENHLRPSLFDQIGLEKIDSLDKLA